MKHKESLTGFLFCLPSILGMFVFFLIPFGISVAISLTESMGSDKFVGLKNYRDVMGSTAFRLAAGNTFRFAAVALPSVMVLSLAAAMLLHRKLRGYDFFRTAFVFPLVLPAAAVVTVFRDLFEPMGLTESSAGSFGMLLILYLWKNAGYDILLFLAALNAVPRSCYEAAELDGAGAWTKLTKITLPMIAPHTFSIFVLSVVNLFKSFREAFLLFGAHPDQSIYMIQHFMNNNFENLNYIRLSVGAILIFLVIFVLVLGLLILRKRGGDVEL